MKNPRLRYLLLVFGATLINAALTAGMLAVDPKTTFTGPFVTMAALCLALVIVAKCFGLSDKYSPSLVFGVCATVLFFVCKRAVYEWVYNPNGGTPQQMITAFGGGALCILNSLLAIWASGNSRAAAQAKT
jgi:hypothetical protein